MSLSEFPNKIDTFLIHTDAQADDLEDLLRIDSLQKTPIKSIESTNELNTLIAKYRDKLFMAEDLNKLGDSITQVQIFFRDNVIGYIQIKQDEFQVFIDRKKQEVIDFINQKTDEMNNYIDTKITELTNKQDETVKFVNVSKQEVTNFVNQKENELSNEINKFTDRGKFIEDAQYYAKNYVTHNDGTGDNTYLCFKDCKNILPTDTSYWRKLSIKGQRGENGIGLQFVGAWNKDIPYKINQAVQFGGKMFGCKSPNTNQMPDLTKDTLFWEKALDITITCTELVGVRVITTNTPNINFIIGEIIAFNPATDVLEVYKNKTRLTKGYHYEINTDNQSIDNLEGEWVGTTESPAFFEFVVKRNQINELVFSDGQSIMNETITLNKFTKNVQEKINKNSFTVIKTNYTASENRINNIPIGHSNFNPKEDILEVKYLNEPLTENENYKINEDNLNINLIDWTLDKGEKIYFKTVKKAINILSKSDGSLLEENSVNESKLSKELQGKINKEIKAADIKTLDGKTVEELKTTTESQITDVKSYLADTATKQIVATENNITFFDNTGNIKDSGKAIGNTSGKILELPIGLTIGDLLRVGSDGQIERLPKGIDGQGLILANGLPSWGMSIKIVKGYYTGDGDNFGAPVPQKIVTGFEPKLIMITEKARFDDYAYNPRIYFFNGIGVYVEGEDQNGKNTGRLDSRLLIPSEDGFEVSIIGRTTGSFGPNNDRYYYYYTVIG